MAIHPMFSSNINVGSTCSNCIHRHQPSTFKRCTVCLDKGTVDTPYPMHQEDSVEGADHGGR
ncbi:hypothetical protein [Geobacter sp. SVR]|uniref:hypothetical protein n=1 Tax=Geobacter sp. SVR TaxID=2495594 RepID=UPI00143EFEBD|nr:hypothetical protein [Geobacter sp. SVR]BCS54531.1 hypothetical protein GSVR_28390 [Geobacter sp. SVR]GCF87131.1 hypothetical protein GSbR_37310 [Geobacter sp. SVR]